MHFTIASVSERAESCEQCPGREQCASNAILDAGAPPQLAVLDLQVGIIDREIADSLAINWTLCAALRQPLLANLADCFIA